MIEVTVFLKGADIVLLVDTEVVSVSETGAELFSERIARRGGQSVLRIVAETLTSA